MIYVALAAFNEEQNIGELLRGLGALAEREGIKVRVVVVDDGSRDETARVVESFQDRLKILLIRQSNQGFLKALTRALREVLQRAHEDDTCVTLDADNTHPADLIPQMYARVEQGSDVVIASRFQEGGGMRGVPFYRSWLSTAARFVMVRSVGIPQVRDYSTAFRAYRVKVLKEAFKRYGDEILAGKGFSGMAGFLIRLSFVTRHITEIPLILRYDLKEGSSRMNVLKTLVGYFELLQDYHRGKFRS